MADNLRLQVVLSAVDRATAPFKKMMESSSGLAQKVKAAREQLKELEAANARLEAFRKTRAHAAQTGNALSAATQKVAALKREMAATENPTKAQARAIAKAVQEAGRLKETHQKLIERQQRLRAELERAGMPTRELARHQGELRRRLAEANAVLSEQERRLRAHGETLQRTAAARAQYEKALATRNALMSNGMGTAMTGVAIGAPLLAPVKLAVDYESAFADVKKVVDFETPEGAAKLSQELLELSRRIPLAATELAALAASAGQLGVAEKDIAGFTETVAKMSTAFDMSAEAAGDAMAKLANVYAIPVGKIGELGDVINHLSNSDAAKAPDIVNALSRIGGTAKQIGLSSQQAAGLASTLLALSKTPEVAATGINAMLIKLMTAEKQGSKFQAALAQIGTTGTALQQAIGQDAEGAIRNLLETIAKLPEEQHMGVLLDLFGMEYADDVALLVGKMDKYREHMARATDATATAGSMENEFAARAATTANQLQLTRNNAEELGITMGATLLPAINQLLKDVRPVIERFTQWARENPQTVSTLLKVGAAVAALVVVGGTLAMAIAAVLGPFAILRFVLAKVGLQSAATAASMGGLGTRLSGLLPKLGRLTGAIGGLWAAWEVGQTIGGKLSGWMDAGLSRLLGYETSLGSALYDLVHGARERLVTAFADAWQAVDQAFSKGIAFVTARVVNWSPFGAVYQGIARFLSYFGIQLPENLTAAGGKILAAIRSGFAAVWSDLIGMVGNWKELGGMLIDGLWQGLSGKWEGLKAKVGEIADSLKTTVTEKLGIHSPSRVFAELGAFTMQGLAEGLAAAGSEPLAAVKKLAGGLAGAFALSLPALAAPAAPGGDLEAGRFDVSRFDVRAPLTAPAPASAPAAGGAPAPVSIQIVVNPAPGMDEQKLADLIAQKVAEAQRTADVARRSRLTDSD